MTGPPRLISIVPPQARPTAHASSLLTRILVSALSRFAKERLALRRITAPFDAPPETEFGKVPRPRRTAIRLPPASAA